MIKQVLITSIAAAGLLLSAQASAHGVQTDHHVNGEPAISWNHSHNTKPARRPAPKRKKYNVNKEQRQQATMIAQGVRTCQITPREAGKLNRQQARIRKAERRMRKDGLQRWERMNLKNRLHKARVQINSLTKNSKQCGRANKKRRGGRKHQHSHGSKHHKHSNGNHFHSHSSWSTSNGHNSFSISIGH